MKKAILFVFTSLLFTSAFGQFRLGAEGGLTLFNTTHTAIEYDKRMEENGKYKVGGKLGLIAEYSLLKRLSVQFAPSITMKGFRDVLYFNNGSGTPESSFRWSAGINYVELPISMLLRFGQHLRVGAGGYYSYALSGKGKIIVTDMNGPTVTWKKDLTFDNKQTPEAVGFEKIDYGLQFSASYLLPHNAFIQGQFSKGLNDIMHEVPFQTKTETYKNWGFIISVGWYFVSF